MRRTGCVGISQKHPRVLLAAFSGFGDGRLVVAEFPLGSEYRADFVTLSPFSGGWEINFVEMEPPTARLFNADGSAAKSLNRARAQIADWRTFVEKNRTAVVRDLARFAQEKDLVLGARDHGPPRGATPRQGGSRFA